MSERFHAADLDPHARAYTLEGPEARHLATVLRAKAGDPIELFDGRGLSVAARIAKVERRLVELEVLGPTNRSSTRSGLTIACALPKGERAAWLVEKCTELGVDALVPLRTERSVTDPGEGKLDRLKRVSIEACKQSGRDRVLEIHPPADWSDFALSVATPRWLLDPGGAVVTGNRTEPVLVAAIGPEGGWTDDERNLAAEHGWKRVGFPGQVLRVETAAIAIAARFCLDPAV